MFSKKILSIVGLLFVSSKVYASYDDCQPTYESPNCMPSYCESGDDGYYRAKITGELVVVSNSATKATCELVTDDGYYVLKDDATRVSKKGNTITLVTGIEASATDCSGASDEGKFFDGSVFCLEQNKPLALSSGASYLYTDVETIFTDTATKKVIVKSTGEAVVLDKELMGKTYNYCVDSNLRVLNRKEDLCTNSSGECEYYQCANGECKKEAANLPPLIERANPECNLDSPNDETCMDGGYYLYDTNVGRTDVLNSEDITTGTVKLAKCTKNAQNEWSCPDVTGADIPIGYVTNSGAGGEYIKCESDGSCTAVAVIEPELNELSAGTYMIDISSSGLLGIESQSLKYVNVIKTGISVLVDRESKGYYTVSGTAQKDRAYQVDNAAAAELYSCDVESNISKCSKVGSSDIPIGYLINKGVGTSEKPFIKCDVNKPCEAVAPAPSCGDNHGDLYIDGDSTKICGVTDGVSDLILAGTYAISGEKYYMASVATTNDKLFDITNKAGYFVVLKFEGGNVTVENDSNARYRYTKNNSNLIVDRSDAITDTNGICKSENDGYPNAYEYILANWAGAKDGLDTVISYYVSEEYNEQNN